MDTDATARKPKGRCKDCRLLVWRDRQCYTHWKLSQGYDLIEGRFAKPQPKERLRPSKARKGA